MSELLSESGPDLQALVPSAEEYVVAVEPGDGNASIFLRKDDKLECREIAFQPFLLLGQPQLLNGGDLRFEMDSLSGSGRFQYRARFPDRKEYEHAVRALKQGTGINPSSPNAPYRVFSDLTQQLLSSSGIRLFRGMTFGQLRRVQFDIETACSSGYDFPNPEREEDCILMISMRDSTGWECCLGENGKTPEAEILANFAECIRERDPDVLEGHNICRFDLPYIETRAKRHKIALKLGRDGSVIRGRNSRLSVAERTLSYTRYDIFGRHVVDTFHLVQFYDISHRDLSSYNLKEVARHFGVAAPNRTYVDPADITRLFRDDPKTLSAYAMDDVRETAAIAELLSPSYFYQAQLVPMSYQNCIVRGNATRIDALLTAAYLTEAAALPVPEGARPFSGALTESFEAGVFKNIWHCDVRSLYPSIILAEKWCPARDHLGVFRRLLMQLRDFRLAARKAEKEAADSAIRDAANALQTTFKILINSFYGYLGFSQGTFNDFAMAENVTSRGREILTKMLEFLREENAKVIEMDTDGIYFQPPPGIDDPVAFESRIQAVLPTGIDVEIDDTYAAMFSYKSKNYAVLKEDGEIAITGAALKSRGLEPFQREWLSAFIGLLLHEDYKGIVKLIEESRAAIEKRDLPIAKFAKTETLQDSPENYRRKLDNGKGRRSAAYELALKSKRNYRQGDQVAFYVTGDKKRVSVVENSKLLSDAEKERNENTAYYLAKFDDLVKKFSEFIPQDVHAGDGQLELGI